MAWCRSLQQHGLVRKGRLFRNVEGKNYGKQFDGLKEEMYFCCVNE